MSGFCGEARLQGKGVALHLTPPPTGPGWPLISLGICFFHLLKEEFELCLNTANSKVMLCHCIFSYSRPVHVLYRITEIPKGCEIPWVDNVFEFWYQVLSSMPEFFFYCKCSKLLSIFTFSPSLPDKCLQILLCGWASCKLYSCLYVVFQFWNKGEWMPPTRVIVQGGVWVAPHMRPCHYIGFPLWVPAPRAHFLFWNNYRFTESCKYIGRGPLYTFPSFPH